MQIEWYCHRRDAGMECKFFLTLCILMDFPIPIDTISMGVPIVYFMGSQVEFSKL